MLYFSCTEKSVIKALFGATQRQLASTAQVPFKCTLNVQLLKQNAVGINFRSLFTNLPIFLVGRLLLILSSNSLCPVTIDE